MVNAMENDDDYQKRIGKREGNSPPDFSRPGAVTRRRFNFMEVLAASSQKRLIEAETRLWNAVAAHTRARDDVANAKIDLKKTEIRNDNIDAIKATVEAEIFTDMEKQFSELEEIKSKRTLSQLQLEAAKAQLQRDKRDSESDLATGAADENQFSYMDFIKTGASGPEQQRCERDIAKLMEQLGLSDEDELDEQMKANFAKARAMAAAMDNSKG